MIVAGFLRGSLSKKRVHIENFMVLGRCEL